MLTANAILAVFSILGISSLAVFWAKKVHLPHTVFLVLTGVGLGIIAEIEHFNFLKEFTLTPELLFFLLLPTLIFESAYNISIRRMVEDTVPILLLSVVGLLISTAAIGIALWYFANLIGLAIPLILTLIFGALISITDTAAVLALFKEYGAPRRLSLIFEGESLFNDATALALFLILIDIATFGFAGFTTVSNGLFNFTTMMVGGVIFGLIAGGFFAKLIGMTRESHIASVTLTLVSAHLTYVLAEILSHSLTIGQTHIFISPIIATTIAALLIGNYGRAKIHPSAQEFTEKFWEQFAFLANSLVFILIGIIFTSVDIHLSSTMIITVLATVLIVATARALAVYPLIAGFNFFSKTRHISRAWQHLLAYGSLRGAFALVLVLMIPEDLVFPGWNLSMTPQEFLLAITVGCIFATTFIKATTIKFLIAKLGIDTLTPLEEIESLEAKALVHHEITAKVSTYAERGYINQSVAASLTENHKKAFLSTYSALETPELRELSERVLRIFAIGIEKLYLKELYHHHEVSEAVFRKLSGKLQLQLEAIEEGNLSPNTSMHTDGKDVFDWLASQVRKLYRQPTANTKINDTYMYYRAQTILARKVLKELAESTYISTSPLFINNGALARVTALYDDFKIKSEDKMKQIAKEHPENSERLSLALAVSGVHKISENTLEELFERQLITPKLYANLKEELLSRE